MTIRRVELGQGALFLAIGVACSGCAASAERDTPALGNAASPDEVGSAARDAGAAEPASNAGAEPDAGSEVVSELPAAARCATPPGVSGRPKTIGEAVALMNALPRPTSVACFLESLTRPLDVYFTRSQLSAQPADGNDSPRTFVVNDALFISSVPSGFARNTIELGFRTSPERAIRAEIAFPLRSPVTVSSMAEHIAVGDRFTLCGFCHAREARVSDPFLGELAFESEVIPPDPDYELGVDAVRALAEACDPLATAERCVHLNALFGHGALQRSRAFDAPL